MDKVDCKYNNVIYGLDYLSLFIIWLIKYLLYTHTIKNKFIAILIYADICFYILF